MNEEARTITNGTSLTQTSEDDIHGPGYCVKLVSEPFWEAGAEQMAAAIAMELNKVTSDACRQLHVGINRNNLGEQNVQVANDRLTEFGVTVDVSEWEDTSHFNLSWLS